ncbi:hypothetical protein RKE30_28710 [Streptomyces sp. Li-HN-5-11]|nr:hypothetical protein [Streptomyces sp. Li-HN-5-11]WNM34071.1 hypothetical protein RKE30_28710 [Streptomyces sp. Li-HN-5-11]
MEPREPAPIASTAPGAATARPYRRRSLLYTALAAVAVVGSTAAGTV